MKKIYSFVLMATMLLIGANAWADDTQLSDVQAAFGNATSITLNEESGFGWLQFDGQLVFNQPDKHFVLDLGGLTLKMNNSDKVGILVERGTLEIKNGTITNVNNKTIDLIRVIGTTETGWDAANENAYSRLIVDASATVNNNTLLASGTKYNALTIIENATKVGGKLYANGARIDVYGKANGYTYGIKVNGNVARPGDDADAAYVYIHKDAEVTAHSTNGGSVAAYSSGFALWRIEGTCSASTGLYVKGGQIEVANATITSEQNNQVVPTTGGKSGVNAGGSAIVIESNSNYPGDISVAISGTSTIQGAGGYAIEETLAANVSATEVEIISIQGGNLSGNAGAIIVDDKSDEKVTVAGGNIDGTIQVSGATVQSVSVEQFINGTTSGEEPDYTVTKTGTPSDNPTYSVTPNLSKVAIMNAYGFSTFSTNVGRKIKAADAENLKAYKAQYNNGELVLTQITGEDIIIPANNGVILWGANNESYSFEAVDNSSVLADNDLRPATAWEADYAEGNSTFFVLSGNMMYKWVGNGMKANKAYLKVAQPVYQAPARIRMVIAETEQETAVENVETETVKAQKFIENGQVLIQRGENVYNVQGQIVK